MVVLKNPQNSEKSTFFTEYLLKTDSEGTQDFSIQKQSLGGVL